MWRGPPRTARQVATNAASSHRNGYEGFGARTSHRCVSQRWLIVFVDGFEFVGHTMIGALGVTADGTKVPLGVVEGSTENATVARGLIAGLRDRGLDASEGVLFRPRRRQSAQEGGHRRVRRQRRDRPL